MIRSNFYDYFQVGSIVAIGIYGKTGIPKKQIINIALAWFVTVPTSGLLSAIIMKILMFIKPLWYPLSSIYLPLRLF